MYELLYCSLANPYLVANDISNILKKSLEWNAQHEITGCLLFYNTQFIQILEGDKQAVKELYAIIEKDSRHHHVVLLAENEKEESTFKDWRMAFNELSKSDMNDVDKVLCVNNFITFATKNHTFTKATKMFCDMANAPFRKLTNYP
jgi:hypothetical protein